jgi:thiamine biosynthesis protein ThiS
MRISGAHLKPCSLATIQWPKWIRFFYFLMKLKINGEEKEMADGLNLTSLLEQLQIRPARVVVERNREIVPRESYGTILLAEGDTLEIVHFVGGG